MNKVGLIDIKKAYLGTKLLSPNNAFVGTEQLLEDRDHLIISKRGGSGTVTVTFLNISANQTIQYSKHPYGTFTTASVNSAVTLTGDEKLYLKGNLTADNDGDNGDYTNIKITSNSAATDWATLSGNCSAIWSSGLRKQCGLRLFSGSWAVRYVSENFLPATTLAHACYQRLFENCTWLMNVPKLPATSISSIGNIYQYMFYGCSKLTTVPSDLLPIMDLSGGGVMYGGMFGGCTSLTTAPNLPATVLGQRCYDEMFYGCTSLTNIPQKLPATTLANQCYRNMFRGCTSLTTAPELPATTLANYCYDRMFYGCSTLNYIKCFATNISATNCTANWVYGVAPTGTFVKSPSMSSWTIGDSGIPTGWVVLSEKYSLVSDIRTLVDDDEIIFVDSNSGRVMTEKFITTTNGSSVLLMSDQEATFTNNEITNLNNITTATLNNNGNKTVYNTQPMIIKLDKNVLSSQLWYLTYKKPFSGGTYLTYILYVTDPMYQYRLSGKALPTGGQPETHQDYWNIGSITYYAVNDVNSQGDHTGATNLYLGIVAGQTLDGLQTKYITNRTTPTGNNVLRIYKKVDY